MADGIHRRLGVVQLQDQGLTGHGIRVGIAGTGIDLSHADLAFRTVGTRSFTSPSIDDIIGHDTAVTCIIAGSGSKKCRLKGIAPEASLVLAKVTEDNGSAEEDVLIDALQWLAGQGVQVINFSITSDCVTDGRDPVSREVNYLVERRGIGVVCAAGNYGPVHYSIGSPGAAEKAITVGCVNNRDVLRLASSRGPTLDGRVKPDCVAPGERILAARAKGTHSCQIHNSRQGFFDLSSFATPHVTGIYVLLKQAYPDADPATIKQALLATCDLAHMPSLSRITGMPSGVFYRIRAALKRLTSTKQLDEKCSLGHGRVNGYRAYVKLEELMNDEKEKVLASKPPSP